MKFQIDHDLHIHSRLSFCSDDPEQTTDAILRYGETNGMTSLALTDHYWDRLVHGAVASSISEATRTTRRDLPTPPSSSPTPLTCSI